MLAKYKVNSNENDIILLDRVKKIVFFLIFLPWLSVNALENPMPPKIKLIGTKGNIEAAYWVVAADKNGKTTNVSKAAVMKSLPNKLNTNNYVKVTVLPVKGGEKYYILKTIKLHPPKKVSISAGKPGNKTFYYWIATQNTWRLSELGGPYTLKNAASAKGNVIKWEAVPTANNYQIFRTERPVKPMGYNCRAVGDTQLYGRGAQVTKFIDSDRLGSGWVPSGYPATPIEERPQGLTNCLLAETTADKLTISDKGQQLKSFMVPTVNTTKRIAFDQNADKHVDLRGKAGRPSAIFLESREHLKAKQPTFGTGANLLSLKQVADSGGHSDRNRYSSNAYHGKTNHHVIEMMQELHVASQSMTIGGYQIGYGSGDMIFFHPHQSYYGTNNDGGDEGVYPVRQSLTRGLNRYESTLAKNAPRGATKIKFKNMRLHRFGTDRLVVNFSKSYTKGRVIKVDNVTINGKGTKWTPDMEGWWISFDIENTNIGKRSYRMWYMVEKVYGPTKLRIRAFTNWSDHCNLGYSRWIYDPKKQAAPAEHVSGNYLAIRNLPENRKKAASEGKYIIASATMLGDPWKKNGYLNVAPLNCDWNKGDKVAIAAGPQAYIGGGRIMLMGNYLPQDLVTGLELRNTANRKTNGAGLLVGIPGQANFADGIFVNMAMDGHGNGIVIRSDAEKWNGKDDPRTRSGAQQGALVLPRNMPAIVSSPAKGFPHIRFTYWRGKKQNSLDIQSPYGKTMASFTKIGNVIFSAPVEFKNDVKLPSKMRGKMVFNGNGKQKTFAIDFNKPFKETPFVTFSSNQFIPSRLVKIERKRFTVEFKTPPKNGENNVIIYYLSAM